jgi:hypothetical protein
MQHVAPLEQHVLERIHLFGEQYGQLYQGMHVLLASTLSSPRVLRDVQRVLRKPVEVAPLHMGCHRCLFDDTTLLTSNAYRCLPLETWTPKGSGEAVS